MNKLDCFDYIVKFLDKNELDMDCINKVLYDNDTNIDTIKKLLENYKHIIIFNEFCTNFEL